MRRPATGAPRRSSPRRGSGRSGRCDSSRASTSGLRPGGRARGCARTRRRFLRRWRKTWRTTWWNQGRRRSRRRLLGSGVIDDDRRVDLGARPEDRRAARSARSSHVGQGLDQDREGAVGLVLGLGASARPARAGSSPPSAPGRARDGPAGCDHDRGRDVVGQVRHELEPPLRARRPARRGRCRAPRG